MFFIWSSIAFSSFRTEALGGMLQPQACVSHGMTVSLETSCHEDYCGLTLFFGCEADSWHY